MNERTRSRGPSRWLVANDNVDEDVDDCGCCHDTDVESSPNERKEEEDEEEEDNDACCLDCLLLLLLLLLLLVWLATPTTNQP